MNLLDCVEHMAGQISTDTMVSLHTPFRKYAEAYGHLTAVAFLVTDDFQLDDEKTPYEPSAVVPLSDRFDLQGKKTSMSTDESIQDGIEGEALPVCGALLPLPFGYWQGDYFSVGLAIPANYCMPDDSVIQCGPSGLDLISAGKTVASTRVWHDDWSPVYPRGGHTRCGVTTTMNSAQLTKVRSELGLRLAWVVERHVWKRETDYGDYKLRKRSAVVINR